MEQEQLCYQQTFGKFKSMLNIKTTRSTRFKILSSRNQFFRTPYIMVPDVYVYEALYLTFASLLCNR